MTEEEALATLRGDDPAAVARAEAELWTMWCRSGVEDVDAFLDDLLDGVEAAGGVPLLLLIVAGVACWIPARRATLVEPMVVLRED